MKKILYTILTLFIATGVQAQLDRSKRPEPGPAPEIKLEKPHSFELENGLKVFVVENHKLPRISWQLTLDVDPVMEGDAVGYLDAMGDLLRRGTTNRSKDDIDSEVDMIGARLSTSSSGVYGQSLTKYSKQLLDIMTDVVMNSEFSQDELDKITKQMKSSLANQKDNPDAIASKVRGVLNYGKEHPYGEVQTEESIDNITLGKCKSYYESYFKPNTAYLAVVGDITPDEAKKLVKEYFSEWKKGEVPEHKYDTPTHPENNEVAVAHKAGASQSLINVTYPIMLKPGDKDAIPATLLNQILGGGSSARLFVNLRETHGYTYGCYSRVNDDELIGSFRIFAKVRNEVTDSAVTEIIREMKKIRNEPVSKDELEGVKNYLNGNFAISLEDPRTIARLAINIERYDLPEDYYSNYLKMVEQTSIEDIQRVAKKYILPEQANILVVGDKDEIVQKLTKFDANGNVDLYDAVANKLEESTIEIPEGLTAEKVVENYLEAIGSRKALKKVKSKVTKMTATLQGRSLTVTSYKMKDPLKMNVTTEMGEMVLSKQVYDGEVGKVTSMQGEQEITGDDLEEMKLQATMNIEAKYDDLGYKLELKGAEKVNGRDAYKVSVISPTGKEQVEFYDAENWYKLRVVETQETQQGETTATTDFGDYKEVKGVKYPHALTQQMGPQTIEMKVTAVEINSKIGKDKFKVE